MPRRQASVVAEKTEPFSLCFVSKNKRKGRTIRRNLRHNSWQCWETVPQRLSGGAAKAAELSGLLSADLLLTNTTIHGRASAAD